MNQTSSTTTRADQDHDDVTITGYSSLPFSSTTTTSPANGRSEEELPLPPSPSPPVPVLQSFLYLWSLPDVAHDAIASYLTMIDTHCMMETNQHLMEVYEGQAKELTLVRDEEARDEGSTTTTTTVFSLLRRRSELVHITVGVNEMMGVVARAMEEGYLNKLQELEVVDPSWRDIKSDHILALCDALANGTCPNINKLVVPSRLLPCLGDVMRGRMERGCCGLKSLDIGGHYHSRTTSYLSSLLSSRACETLEEFKLALFNSDGWRSVEKAAMSEWLSETKAPHLRTLVLLTTSNNQIQALCSPSVAPRLQVLDLYILDYDSFPLLSQAIGGGAWPHLTELRISTKVSSSDAARLVEAIGVGARELTTLDLRDLIVCPEGGMAVARMLRNGGCPRLEELDLSYNDMGDGNVVELARALEGGAPCNTTLRRLNLECCFITSVDLRELMESIGRGALPHLEFLNLGANLDINDDGVVAFAEAMSGGSLRYLQELHFSLLDMDQRGVKALFQAFQDHKPCPHLKKLDLDANEMIGDVGVMHLAKAIEAEALQHLQELDLSSVGMGEKGFKSLVKAIVTQQPNPGCPRLEVLSVSGNRGIGDGGVIYLAEMMKMKGAMQHLRQLCLQGVSMTVEEVITLVQSLGEDRVCPNLEQLGLGRDFKVHGGNINLRLRTNARAGVLRQSLVEFMDMRRRERHYSKVKIT